MTTPAIYDFSGRDFTSEFERLLTLLKADLPEYTDWNHSDAGIVLLRLLARETDLLNDYIDRVFAEGFLRTAWFKQSLVELGNLVDCLPKLANAAATTMTVTRVPNAEFDALPIPLPAGTPFMRKEGIEYTFQDAVTIAVGTQSIELDVLQGDYISIDIAPEEITEVDLMGHPKYNLGKNVSAGTVRVTSDNGNTVWTEVDSFYRSFDDDNHFKLELYADLYDGETDTVYLVLGNGEHGLGVPITSLNVSYIKTDGLDGNTGATTITELDSEVALMVAISNAEPATGGAYAETIDAYRSRLPYIVRTQRRGVTQDDYEALVVSIPGVADCQCLDRNTSQDYPWEYAVIYILPEGGGNMSGTLQSTVYNTLMDSGGLGGWQGRYILHNAIPVAVPITCRLSVTPGYSTANVETALRTAIATCFEITIDIVNEPFDFGNLNVVCGRVAGVNYIEFDAPEGDVEMSDGEYPVAGAISVTLV